MLTFKIFEFGEELYGGTFHILLKKILLKSYSHLWKEANCEIDNLYWIPDLYKNIQSREKTRYKRYKRYEQYYIKNKPDKSPIMDRLPKKVEEENKLYNWDLCSESRWSKICFIIPEIFFLDSKLEMDIFMKKIGFKYYPNTLILQKKNNFNLSQINSFLNKRIFVKPSGFSVYKANGEDNNSGNHIRIYHKCKELDIKKEYELLKDEETLIIQKSVEPLMLYEGRKFDIRFHVLFLVYKGEMMIFSHKFNFCRVTVKKYDVMSENNSLFITNYNYQGLDDEFNAEDCQIMSYRLENYREIHKKMKDSVVEIGRKIIENIKIEDDGKPKIWLSGWDFIVDGCYNPWLLEINHNPGFLTPYPKEKYEKVNVKGIYSLIDYFINPIFEKKEIEKKNQGVFNFLFSSKL